jgi:hypothetical protein
MAGASERLWFASSPPLERLRTYFAGWRATAITTPINEYIVNRRSEDMTVASFNRELAALRRMFNLKDKLPSKPKIELLPENNPREGLFQHAECEALTTHNAFAQQAYVASEPDDALETIQAADAHNRGSHTQALSSSHMIRSLSERRESPPARRPLRDPRHGSAESHICPIARSSAWSFRAESARTASCRGTGRDGRRPEAARVA